MTAASLPEAIAEVSAALSRIEKKGTAPSQMGGFSFVRETDVIEALKPELDSRGIVLRPDVELLRVDTFPRQGKDMPNTVATISLALYAVRGAEEYLIARTIGQGADTQDKAVGKAVTAAKKQGILVAFAIPTGDDPDASAIPERSANKQGQRSVQPEAQPRKAASAPVSQPATPELMALKRSDWASANFGWTKEGLEQAAFDATNVALGEMSNEIWRAFVASVVQGGPTEKGAAATPPGSPAPEPEAAALLQPSPAPTEKVPA